MAVIIEGIRPVLRIADNKSGPGEPPDAIPTSGFRTSGGRIGLPRVVTAPPTGGTWTGPKKSHESSVVEVDHRKKPTERPTLVFAPYEKYIALTEECSICRLDAPIDRASQPEPNRKRGPE